eukprot:scaffold20786_cov68-Phaeocystis_antarctica.AAC.2
MPPAEAEANMSGKSMAEGRQTDCKSLSRKARTAARGYGESQTHISHCTMFIHVVRLGQGGF